MCNHIMKYKYLFENNANKNIKASDIFNQSYKHNFLYILCYYITDSAKYPFLQFMMDKIPFCNNFIKETVTLPAILFNNTTNIEELVLKKVKDDLNNI